MRKFLILILCVIPFAAMAEKPPMPSDEHFAAILKKDMKTFLPNIQELKNKSPSQQNEAKYKAFSLRLIAKDYSGIQSDMKKLYKNH